MGAKRTLLVVQNIQIRMMQGPVGALMFLRYRSNKPLRASPTALYAPARKSFGSPHRESASIARLATHCKLGLAIAQVPTATVFVVH